MSKVKVELISSGVRELLKCDEIAEVVREATNQVQANAGSGYEASFQISNRAVGRVKAGTYLAHRDNLKNNTLLKALRPVK